MNLQGAFLGGLAGALVSSAAWVGIGYATGYELGILAVGVGIACGIGAAIGAKGRAGVPGGVVAALCAMFAIVAARYVLVQISLERWLAQAPAEQGEIPGPEDNEFWTAFIADRIADDRVETGEDFSWIEHEGAFDDDSLANDYHPEIWTAASSAWESMTPADREAFCQAGAKAIVMDHAQDADEAHGAMTIIGVLIANLHPMALVLMGISMAGAFKIARDSRPAGADLGEAFVDASDEALNEELQQPAAQLTGLPGMPTSSGMCESAAATTQSTGSSNINNEPSAPTPADAQSVPTGLPGMPPPTSTGPRKFYSGEIGA